MRKRTWNSRKASFLEANETQRQVFKRPNDLFFYARVSNKKAFNIKIFLFFYSQIFSIFKSGFNEINAINGKTIGVF